MSPYCSAIGDNLLLCRSAVWLKVVGIKLSCQAQFFNLVLFTYFTAIYAVILLFSGKQKITALY